MLDEQRATQLRTRQLAMSEQTWSVLQSHGLSEQSAVRLDFSYDAPGPREAEALAAFLQRETDYDVVVRSARPGLLRKKLWDVSGSTQPTPVSRELILQWVDWMVTAGAQQGCEFDGWGTAVG